MKHVSEKGFKRAVGSLWRWALQLNPPDARVPSRRFILLVLYIHTSCVYVVLFVMYGRTDGRVRGAGGNCVVLEKCTAATRAKLKALDSDPEYAVRHGEPRETYPRNKR